MLSAVEMELLFKVLTPNTRVARQGPANTQDRLPDILGSSSNGRLPSTFIMPAIAARAAASRQLQGGLWRSLVYTTALVLC